MLLIKSVLNAEVGETFGHFCLKHSTSSLWIGRKKVIDNYPKCTLLSNCFLEDILGLTNFGV